MRPFYPLLQLSPRLISATSVPQTHIQQLPRQFCIHLRMSLERENGVCAIDQALTVLCQSDKTLSRSLDLALMKLMDIQLVSCQADGLEEVHARPSEP